MDTRLANRTDACLRRDAAAMGTGRRTHSYPFVLERAEAVRVWDAAGNQHLSLAGDSRAGLTLTHGNAGVALAITHLAPCDCQADRIDDARLAPCASIANQKAGDWREGSLP